MPNNIENFNQPRSIEYVKLIEEVLGDASRRKMKFSKRAHLKKYVAEQTGIHPTTLKRNGDYWDLLNSHMRNQPGAGAFVEDAIDISVVETSLIIAIAKISRLEGELRASRKQLAVAQDGGRQMEVARSGPRVGNREIQTMEIALNDTCALLAAVLARAEVYAIDRDLRVLFDKTERPGSELRIMGSVQRAAPFMQWVELNHMLPYVRDVPRGSAKG